MLHLRADASLEEVASFTTDRLADCAYCGELFLATKTRHFGRVCVARYLGLGRRIELDRQSGSSRGNDVHRVLR